MARSRLFVAVALLAALPCFAQFPNETDRLMATAKLWVTVEYFHPYLAYRDIDWDQALITAIPKIRTAKDTNEYRTAVGGMLDELHDPETRIVSENDPPSETASTARQLSLVHTPTGVAFRVSERPMPLQSAAIDFKGFVARVRLSEPLMPVPEVRAPKAESTDSYPSTEARLLAAIKTWGAIHYFFAYKDLMDEDWDDIFPAYLAKFIQARDATDYNLVMADLLTHLTDSNTALHSKTLDAYLGEAPVGLRIRLVGKYPIITDILDPASTKSGVHVGDVVRRIGNESITDRFHRFVQYIPASTTQRSGFDTIQKITNGPAGSEIGLTIENVEGKPYFVTLIRRNDPPAPQRTTEPVRILLGNIGYIDMDRLQPEAADDAMLRLKDTQAIIFDLRGQALAAATIAAHLNSDPTTAAALVTTPIALHPDIPTTGIATQTASTFVVKTLPAPRTPLYKGKTIALIDERTIGASEYAGLLLEAANKTEFVGEATAGADSTIAELPLPGGITVTYSTEDIRHGNGGKLQRLGIQPNFLAQTTAQGLRAGKDEALDAALALVSPLGGKQLAFYTQGKR